MRKALIVMAVLCLFLVSGSVVLTQPAKAEVFGQVKGEVVGPVGDNRPRIELKLEASEINPIWMHPLKMGIRNAVRRGVSINTIVLLLLFPLTAALVAFSRQVVGLNGFGIFIPALVSVAFLSTGVPAGLVLFLAIVLAAVSGRYMMRKVRLPYLPRMAVLIWLVVMVVLGLLIISPSLGLERLVGLGIFPVLIFVMLSQSNIEAGITRTWQTAAVMTTETIVIAVIASLLMGNLIIQEWVLINPEVSVLSILLVDWVIGMYKGLRLSEVWRFRKLVSK